MGRYRAEWGNDRRLWGTFQPSCVFNGLIDGFAEILILFGGSIVANIAAVLTCGIWICRSVSGTLPTRVSRALAAWWYRRWKTPCNRCEGSLSGARWPPVRWVSGSGSSRSRCPTDTRTGSRCTPRKWTGTGKVSGIHPCGGLLQQACTVHGLPSFTRLMSEMMLPAIPCRRSTSTSRNTGLKHQTQKFRSRSCCHSLYDRFACAWAWSYFAFATPHSVSSDLYSSESRGRKSNRLLIAEYSRQSSVAAVFASSYRCSKGLDIPRKGLQSSLSATVSCRVKGICSFPKEGEEEKSEVVRGSPLPDRLPPWQEGSCRWNPDRTGTAARPVQKTRRLVRKLQKRVHFVQPLCYCRIIIIVRNWKVVHRHLAVDDASVLAIGHTIRRDKGMNQCLVGLGKFLNKPERSRNRRSYSGLIRYVSMQNFISHRCMIRSARSIIMSICPPGIPSSLLGLTCHVDKDVAMPLIPKADLICLWCLMQTSSKLLPIQSNTFPESRWLLHHSSSCERLSARNLK